MRLLLFLLICSSLIFPSFGPSRLQLERFWTIESPANGTGIAFDGMMVHNGSDHLLVSLITEPEMNISRNSGESIHLLYNGTLSGSNMTLRGVALVDVDYDTDILFDPPIEPAELDFSELTRPDDAIRAQARKLEAPTTLETIRNIANWVHHNVEYDLAYPRGNDAVDVFRDRRGVCVEYSHLFISMAHTLGLETRYVSGYVLTNRWQPHAWVEVLVPDYGWLAVDPTFGEAGILDNSHLIVAYGTDQASSYDSLLSSTTGTAFYADDTVESEFMTDDMSQFGVSIDFVRDQLLIEVTVVNLESEYLFATYNFAAPEKYGQQDTQIILLEPNGERHFYYSLNNSLFDDGFVYTVPFKASANDVKAEKTVTIEKAAMEEPVTEIPSCEAPVAALASLLGIILFRRR